MTNETGLTPGYSSLVGMDEDRPVITWHVGLRKPSIAETRAKKGFCVVILV
jgi:hypothetical protein